MQLHSRATVVMRASDLRRPPVVCKTRFFSEPMKQINAKFGGKVPFHHIFRLSFHNFACLIFCYFFPFLLTWDHMGETTSNDISSESAKQTCSPKFMHTPMKGLYQSCIKNCEISNFGFLGNFFYSFFLERLTWWSMENYKMCDILKRAGRRAKLSEIWDPGLLVTCMWCTFDLVVFNVNLRSFGALVSKWPVFRKWLVVERNGVKFGTRGY